MLFEQKYNISIYFKQWISSFLFSILFMCCDGFQTYGEQAKLFTDKLGPGSGYNAAIRPIANQTNSIKVHVLFDIISILEIDAIKQKFIVNGFLGLSWTDELIAWNPEDYGYTYAIHPFPKDIWRPRMIIINTLEDRDLFEDDYSPLTIIFNGRTSWSPGSKFPVSCKLDLYKYPFDRQSCYIDIYSMGLTSNEIVFLPKENSTSVRMKGYVESGEWKIESTKMESMSYTNQIVGFEIHFELRRLPGFFIINIVVPIVLMSFLNILVFIIPVDSGEKISYGITVLLALTVFMSIVSEQLPRSSDILPLVTVYLLVLTVLSVCTVIVSIIIVFIHFNDEKEVKHQRAASNFKSMFHNFKILNRATKRFIEVKPGDSNLGSVNSDKLDAETKAVDAMMNKVNEMQSSMEFEPFSSRMYPVDVKEGDYGDDNTGVNTWRLIGRHLNCISFIVFMVIWITVTVGFLVEIAK